MSTKRELILANLITTLEGITTGEGYSMTVRKVSRQFQMPDQVNDFPWLYVYSEDERLTHEPDFEERSIWTVGILGYIKLQQSLKSTEMEKLIGDVKKVVMVDTTRGGNCTSTVVDSIVNLTGEPSPFGIFAVLLQIVYHYDVLSP